MSEITPLPNLENPNYIESQIRHFPARRNIVNNTEEKYNSFNSLVVLRKSHITEKKEKYYLNKKNKSINSPRKARNIKCAKFIQNTNDFSINSPLNPKYQNLLNNISLNFNYNCLKNLTNQELDFIFNQNNLNKNGKNNNSMILQHNNNKKSKNSNISNSFGRTKNCNLFKYYNKRNKKNIYSKNLVSNLKKLIRRPSITNVFLKKKLKKSSSSSIISNDKSKTKRNSSKNYSRNCLKSSRKLSSLNVSENEDVKSGNKKFVDLLKKQAEKNKKLLNEMRREQSMFQDRLKVSVGLFSGYKAKKFIFYRDNKNNQS